MNKLTPEQKLRIEKNRAIALEKRAAVTIVEQQLRIQENKEKALQKLREKYENTFTPLQREELRVKLGITLPLPPEEIPEAKVTLADLRERIPYDAVSLEEFKAFESELIAGYKLIHKKVSNKPVTFYKVPFEDALNLVNRKKTIILKGTAYIAEEDLPSMFLPEAIKDDFVEDYESIAKLISLLSVERASDYGSWINVGLVLKNLQDSDKEHDYNKLWHEFSSKCSSEYKYEQTEKKWASFKSTQMKRQLTVRSLKYWAKQDNFEGYHRVTPTLKRVERKEQFLEDDYLKCDEAEFETWVKEAKEHDANLDLEQVKKDLLDLHRKKTKRK